MVKIYLKQLTNNQNLPNNRPSKSNKMWVTEGKFDIIIWVGTCVYCILLMIRFLKNKTVTFIQVDVKTLQNAWDDKLICSKFLLPT